jgi:hypothetical protein
MPISIEDEEIDEDEEQAVAEACEWLKQHTPISNEVVLAEFGLTLEDFEKMGRELPPRESNGTKS